MPDLLHQHLEVLAIPAPATAAPDESAFRRLFLALSEVRGYREFSVPQGPLPLALFRNEENDYLAVNPRGIELAVPGPLDSAGSLVLSLLGIAARELAVSQFAACGVSVTSVVAAPGGSAVSWIRERFLSESRFLGSYSPFGVTLQKTDAPTGTRLRLEQRVFSDEELWIHYESEPAQVHDDTELGEVIDAALAETSRILDVLN